MKRTTILALILTLVAVPAALADRSEVEVRPDGSVVADGQVHDSVLEWQTSEQFRTGPYRCAAEEGLDLELLRLLGGPVPGDCSFGNTTIKPDYESATGVTYYIPVVFHIVYTTAGVGNLPQSLVESQIAVFNEDFQAIAGTAGANGYNTKFHFYLAQTDPAGNATDGVEYYESNAWFTDPGPGAVNDMKLAINWDPTRYFNVYSNDSAGALGYATFPQTDAGTPQDGIVILHSTLGQLNPAGGLFNLGRTGTHEAGHWIGLFHTFQSGCGTSTMPDCYTSGDLVCDTPGQSSPNFGCPVGVTACSGQVSDIENYMNYSDDACMERFTVEQSNRGRCSALNYRQSLLDVTVFTDGFESGDLARWSSSVG